MYVQGQVLDKAEPGLTAGGPDSCELPDVGAGNQTWVLCKNNIHF